MKHIKFKIFKREKTGLFFAMGIVPKCINFLPAIFTHYDKEEYSFEMEGFVSKFSICFSFITGIIQLTYLKK